MSKKNELKPNMKVSLRRKTFSTRVKYLSFSPQLSLCPHKNNSEVVILNLINDIFSTLSSLIDDSEEKKAAKQLLDQATSLVWNIEMAGKDRNIEQIII